MEKLFIRFSGKIELGAFFTAFFALFIYLYTLSPTVGLHDTGEMISCSYNLGITHPTGYPLFCLLNKLISQLLFFGNIAFRQNFLNSILTSVSAGILTYLLTNRVKLKFSLSFLLSLIFATANIVWLNATIAEKYALNLTLFTLLFFLLIDDKFRIKFILFLFGLSFTHHLQTIYFLAGIILALYLRKKEYSTEELIKSIFYLLLPLSLYIYLPLRAGCIEELNWGNPNTTQNLLSHIIGKQYHFLVAFPKNISEWQDKLAQIKDIFFCNLNFILIFSALTFILKGTKSVGLTAYSQGLTGKEKIFILTLLFSNFIFAVRYNIINIADYYIFSIFLLVYLAGAGINRLLKPKYISPLISLVLLAFLFLRLFNFSLELNKRWYFFAYDYGLNLVRTLEPEAILITEGDNFSFPLYYIKHVENYRKDIKQVDIATLYYPWYSPLELPYFSKETTEPKIIIKERLNYLISEYIADYPIYGLNFYTTIPDFNLAGFNSIPYGLLMRYSKKEEKIEKEAYDFILRGVYSSIYSDFRTLELLENYAAAFYILGEFFFKKGELKEAEVYFNKGLDIEPSCKNKKHIREKISHNHFLAHLRLAQIYEKLKDDKRRKFHLNKINLL